MKTGPTNSLVDVPGLRVGHASRQTATADAPGALTGVTVVLAPPDGAVAGVDVRGAAPGTRETDLLDPRRLVERAHAVVFTGGSAYGLASVDGVMQGLEADGVGFPLGEPGSGRVVPIVPAAVVFDLGRGGAFGERPDAAAGLEAYRAATDTAPAQGVVGAGTGAVVGRLKGGIGTASAVLPDGATVGALVVLNAAGSAVHPATGEPYGARFGLPGEFDHLGPLPPSRLAQAQAEGLLGTALEGPLRATTLALIGTDLTLTQAQCTMLATMGADGLARAVRPVHTMVDGDSTFALSVPRRPAPELPELHALLAAAADCVSRAIVYALLAAAPVRTPAGNWPAYLNIQ
ncbi:P1 family peptidase [Pseudonocardia eucalypti]|uniref:P1 family peptidase n=1 Tax=Pseudonocardia eucalypti TaxID=648755 RepID=A0ABP9PLE4_9PSEU|nr:L-aminopeptidase/D-esterase-like protein [Pseudonocardia eucalypti]